MFELFEFFKCHFACLLAISPYVREKVATKRIVECDIKGFRTVLQFYSETGKLKPDLFNDTEEELTHKKVNLSR